MGEKYNEYRRTLDAVDDSDKRQSRCDACHETSIHVTSIFQGFVSVFGQGAGVPTAYSLKF